MERINFLLDKFPKELLGCKIRTDFRVWIAVETYLQDPLNALTVNPTDIINMVFIDEPEDYSLAFQELIAFKAMYKPIKNEQQPQQPIFDWCNDGEMVYSAFMRVYNINLKSIKHMHWWEFMALFNDLGETCELMNAFYYRGVDMSKIKDKDEKNRIAKLKSHYELR